MANDDIIVLNFGVGGDETDASDVATDAATGKPIKRERIVIGGDLSREQILNLLKRNGAWRLPTYDEFVRSTLQEQNLILSQILERSVVPETGQAQSGGSIPVVVASDQSPFSVKSLYGGLPSYNVSTNGGVDTSTAANSVTSIAYLFHPTSSMKTVALASVVVSAGANSGNNPLFVEGAYITAENAAPGGTLQTIQPLSPDDLPSTCLFRSGATGAPTRVSGDLCSAGLVLVGTSVSFNFFQPTLNGQPIIFKPGQASGFEVRTVIGGSNIASAVHITVTMTFVEVG